MQNNEFQKIVQAISDWGAGRQVQTTHTLGPGADDNAAASSDRVQETPSVNAVLSQVVREASTQTVLRAVNTDQPVPMGTSAGVAPQGSDAAASSDPKQTTSKEEVDEITRLNAQMDQLRRATTLHSDLLAENTKALTTTSTQSTRQSQSSGQSTASKIFSNVLGSGFGLTSLVSGIIGLFGGKSSPEPAALQSYSLPPSLQLDAGLTPNGSLAAVQYSQNGLPRAESSLLTQNVTVQIQALDSRSVMDRSDDIAKAVRDAMLHSHSINDVVTDL